VRLVVDLNADLGEGFGESRLEADAALLDLVTSANIACGFHAGDATTMRDTVRGAKERGVTIGAHPSYPDIPGFGRRELGLSSREIARHVEYQIRALADVCSMEGARIAYVKPHGALYNRAVWDTRVAEAIVDAMRKVKPGLSLLGLPSSEMSKAAERFGGQLKEATTKAGETLKTAADERGLNPEGLREVAGEVADTFKSSIKGSGEPGTNFKELPTGAQYEPRSR